MNVCNKSIFKKNYLIAIGIILITVSIIVYTLYHLEIIGKESLITGIITPVCCMILTTIIQAITNNSESNEKLNISLKRLEWHRKNNCKNECDEKVDGSTSLNYDREYKFITKNRGKSDKEIIKEMGNDNYWDNKFSLEATTKKITKGKAQIDWIRDHFIY